MRRSLVHLAPIWISLLIASSIPVFSESSATASDLLVEYTGAVISADTYTYADHIAMLQSIPVPKHDYLRGGVNPRQVVFASYDGDGMGVFVEIHEFDNEEDAGREYSYQNPANNIGDIFVRFSTEEWMVQQGRFLVFVFCYPGYGEAGHDQAASMLVDLLEMLAERMVEVASWELVQDIPVVEFEGDVTWGIEPGDEITWKSGGSSMYKQKAEKTHVWEIVNISGDGLAVLMRRPMDQMEAIQQPGWASGRKLVYTERLDVPHHEYRWSTADDRGLKFEDTSVLVFPLSRGKLGLREIAERQIQHLPEKRVTDSTTSITFYGKTASGMGFTPLKNEWLDMTVNRGTGVVTSYDWYYHDREYSVQTSTTYALIDTSFEMGDRGVQVDELIFASVLGILLICILRDGKPTAPRGSTMFRNFEESGQVERLTYR